MRRLFLICLLLFNSLFVVFCQEASVPPPIDPDFAVVVCGSIVKLSHVKSNNVLHSHDIQYGSGSRQQSVTAFPDHEDPNSYFVVRGSMNRECPRGKPIACNDIVRLQHVNTKKYLHSHLHPSPISHQQEVSCFGSENEGDSGDHWTVECNTSFWTREKIVRLKHTDTGVYLESDERHRYGHPIPGQLEVSGTKQTNSPNSQWTVKYGIFFSK